MCGSTVLKLTERVSGDRSRFWSCLLVSAKIGKNTMYDYLAGGSQTLLEKKQRRDEKDMGTASDRISVIWVSIPRKSEKEHLKSEKEMNRICRSP